MIRENLELYQYEYPFFDKVNSKIQTFIKSLERDSHPYHTRDQTLTKHIKNSQLNIKNREVDIIINWITEIVNRDCFRPRLDSGYVRLRCSEIWGINYEKGGYLGEHIHGGYAYTFSYVVNAPKNSSPIIFTTSGRRVKPIEGQLTFFDSRLKHRVPNNKVEGKCILSGNFIYDWKQINN